MTPAMLGERWLTAWVLLAAALWPRYAAIPEDSDPGNVQEGPTFEELEDLRSRYSAVQISRDSEHIKRDLSRVLVLAQQGDLDTEETTFYFMRMHDYDDNNQLDGLELMQAFDHLLEHNNETSSEAKLVAMVDNLLTVDVNDDGLVSFPEWLSYIRNVKSKENNENGGGVASHESAKHSHSEQ
ncbi:cell growth regulator with EF hand domain protein 1-like isoform X2 [Dermacentor albipictus]|uniref:cell growth regulator with EF hand domain protein 1-like isoform X2 n=1 Tax=Dermacentor albipictus TaxID=60249 RepID=UPI0031FDC703